MTDGPDDPSREPATIEERPPRDEGPSAESAGAAAASEERGKKRRRRKKAEESAAAPVFERPAITEHGWERPRFLRRFPNDPELEPLIRAYELGRYAELRKAAPRVMESSASPEVRRAAEELLRRTEPDPLVKFFLAMTLVLVIAIVIYAYSVSP
ncbi:MAG: hypothetical protein DIU78_020665 [Pseudomonadota bacterium]